jgi:hypothetical protein
MFCWPQESHVAWHVVIQAPSASLVGAFIHTGDNRVKKQTQGKNKAKKKQKLKNSIPGA